MSGYAPLKQIRAQASAATRVRTTAVHPWKRPRALMPAQVDDLRSGARRNLGRPVQAKLEVSQPGDTLEQEAERVAESVMRMPLDEVVPQRPSKRVPVTESGSCIVNRVCSSCSDAQNEEEGRVQRSTDEASSPQEQPVSIDWPERLNRARSSGGEPLSPDVRRFMERRFGASFGQVKVHHDATADALSRGIGARAFATHNDVFFKRGEYAPGSEQGQRLIAHELAHVVQQRSRFTSHLAQRLRDCDRNKSQSAEAGWATEHPGEVFEVRQQGSSDETSREVALWNFCVNESRLRPEHLAFLDSRPAGTPEPGRFAWETVAEHWRRVLLAGIGAQRRGREGRILVRGTASFSGNTRANETLALARAESAKAELIIRGIPAALIDIEGVGSRLPLADEMVTEEQQRLENKARNRRVEITFIQPLQLGAIDTSTASSLPAVSQVSVDVPNGVRSLVRDDNLVLFAHQGRPAYRASAFARGVGPGLSVGFLQLLVSDRRVGTYSPRDLFASPMELQLDYAHCVAPLPCRDVLEATHTFSYDNPSAGPGRPGSVYGGTPPTSGFLGLVDSPGTAHPLVHVDGRRQSWDLSSVEWQMQFLVLLGVRQGNLLQVQSHMQWGLAVQWDHLLGVTRFQRLGDTGFIPGTPTGSAGAVAFATRGPTCRFLTRKIGADVCRPSEHLAGRRI